MTQPIITCYRSLRKYWLQCDMMNLSMLDFVHVDDRDIFMRQMRINQKDLPPELPEEGKSTIPEYANMGLGPDEFESKY